MNLPLQIVFRNIGPSVAIKEMIESWCDRLERHFGSGRLESCRVAVERHHHHGNHFQVRVSIKARDGQIVANRDIGEDRSHEDVYMAIHDSFDSVRRQLDEQVARRRESRKSEGTNSRVGADT